MSSAAFTVRAQVLDRPRAPLAAAALARILGCNYGSSVPAVDFPRLARLHESGRLPLDRLVGFRGGLGDANRALSDLRDAVGLRSVLEPGAA